MLEKPYLVIDITDGELGKIYEVYGFDQSVEIAIKHIRKYHGGCKDSDDVIRNRFSYDLFYIDADNCHIRLAQIEDNNEV